MPRVSISGRKKSKDEPDGHPAGAVPITKVDVPDTLKPPVKPTKIKILSGREGIDVDQFNRRLRPGTPILYWTGEGRGDLRCWPGVLMHQLGNDTWAVHYTQYSRPSYSSTVEFSDRPKIHVWTVPEVYDDWKDGKV